MSFNLNKLEEIAQKLYAPAVAQAYGKAGGAALREVMRMLHELYVYLDPDFIGTLIVFKRIKGDDIPAGLPAPHRFPNSERFASEYDTTSEKQSVFIQLLSDGNLFSWSQAKLDPSNLSKEGIVYVYRNQQEYFVTKGNKHKVFNLRPEICASSFAVPTFRELYDALEDYKRRSIEREYKIKWSFCQVF